MDEEFDHYGVKGMRWGRRKSKGQLSREAKQRYKEQKQANAIVKKRKQAANSRRSLSDGDLDAYINRLKKEKEFEKLVNSDSVSRRAQNFVSSILSDVSKRTLTTVAAGGSLFALKVALDKKYGDGVKLSDIAAYVTPKPKR